MRSWRNGIRATLRSLWRKLLGGSSPLDRTKMFRKYMHKKFILFIFTFFIVKILSANNYMMNCFSPDYKNGAFYKYVKKDKKLLSRPVKQKWTNFCGKSADNIKSECSFEGLKVKKLFVQEDSEKVLKISYVVNFADYSFVEIKSIFNKLNNKNRESETIYKCRKIKI